MTKILICIGGGEIKSKETIEIDRYIAELTKNKAVNRRANALFIPTASHDSMPYFNSFRKTYTSVFDIKVDVALMCYGEMSIEKIAGKIEIADMIYVGGGDTMFMLKKWKEWGIDKLLYHAYEKGTVLCGLSAGAICWFEKLYSDSTTETADEKYHIFNGLGWINGIVSPHYNHRIDDFDKIVLNNYEKAYGIEDKAALVFEDGVLKNSISSDGKAYLLENKEGIISKSIL
jgi:dipeptidase E